MTRQHRLAKNKANHAEYHSQHKDAAHVDDANWHYQASNNYYGAENNNNNSSINHKAKRTTNRRRHLLCYFVGFLAATCCWLPHAIARPSMMNPPTTNMIWPDSTALLIIIVGASIIVTFYRASSASASTNVTSTLAAASATAPHQLAIVMTRPATSAVAINTVLEILDCTRLVSCRTLWHYCIRFIINGNLEPSSMSFLCANTNVMIVGSIEPCRSIPPRVASSIFSK
jgi:hypothetical protein